MKSNYKTGSPFLRLNSLKERKEYLNKEYPIETDMMDDIRKDMIDFAGYRGSDTYNTVTSNTPRAPYVKREGYDKKFPYLSSKHHTANVYNPMQTNVRNRNAMTIAEERKAEQDRILGANPQGTRGSTYFGSNFNKQSEKAAKTAVDRYNYLKNAAAQGEDALTAALSTEKRPNKFGVMVDQEMPVREQFPMSSQVGTTKNLVRKDGRTEEVYAANPRGQSLRNINQFIDLRDRAKSAQDLTDSIRQQRLIMSDFNPSEGLGLDERTGEYKINFGGQ